MSKLYVSNVEFVGGGRFNIKIENEVNMRGQRDVINEHVLPG